MGEKPTTRQGARLTEARLARAAAGKRRVMIYDARCPGLGAKAGAGKVSFFLRYGGRQRRRFLALGRLSENFSLEDARRLAVETLGMVARGQDPVAERAAQTAAAVTFASWMATYTTRTDRTRKEKAEPRRYLLMASKKWGRRALASISRSDVLTLREEVVREAAANVRARRERAKKAKRASAKVDGAVIALDGHASGNRWLAHVGAAFAAAVAEGIITTNPALGIKPLPEAPPRARVLSDEEMGRLIEALENEDEVTSAVFHVLIESGCRVSEILRSRWVDFDLAAGTWRIPSPKSGFPQVVPLAGVTIERLEQLPRVSEWVVPAGDLSKHRADVRYDWLRLKARAKLTGANVHDLRRSYGLAVARGSGLHVASRLLRHRDVRVTAAVYSPLDIGLQRQATEARAAKLLPFKRKGAK
jgi:integrase